MQQADGGSGEMDGGEKRGQPSQKSSSRGQCQINSRRIELPIIIGPQQDLAENHRSRAKNSARYSTGCERSKRSDFSRHGRKNQGPRHGL
jgi:hypothetical protein